LGIDAIVYDPYLDIGHAADLGTCFVVFVCVPTPGSVDGSLDVTPVWKAVADIEPHLAAGAIVAVKSTVPPGTSDALADEYPHLEFASVPEFLVASAALETFTKPDRVVIGARTPTSLESIRALLRVVAPAAPVVAVTPIEAELIKLCSNAMLAAKVSLANELALVCEAFGTGWDRVREGVGLDTRIGSAHMSVSEQRGFSGGCLPKDLDGLVTAARKAGHVPLLLQGVVDFNRMIRRVDLLATSEAQ
jgi:UDPglucose 6-dehydrogenase